MGLTILENGLDFIISSIKYLGTAERRECDNEELELKYSLLHLSSGIELILKNRLIEEHWTYVFANMNKATRKDFDDGSFGSVDIMTNIDRLKNLCGVDIGKDSEKAFKELRNLRNKMEHFTLKQKDLNLMETCINNALEAIIGFIAKECVNSIPLVYRDAFTDESKESEQDMMKTLIKRISNLDNHSETAYKIAKALALATAENSTVPNGLVECPSCKEKLLACNYKEKETCYCFFCGYEKDCKTTAKEYINDILNTSKCDTIKDGEEYPLYECVDCSEKTMVKTNEKYICFSCSLSFDFDDMYYCENCGKLFWSFRDDITMCYECECADYKLKLK